MGLGFPRGSVFARTNLFPSFLDNICAYGSWFRMVDLALSVEVILWFDWCWVWLLGFRKHELLMLNSHWLSRVRGTFVCQLMRHILSWVTTRSSLLNRIFAAPGGQYRRLCFLIWFETLCASELFRVTGKSNCTGSILVSRTYKVLLLFGIRVSSCSSIGDLVVKIWLTSRSSLPFLDATVIIWHYRSNCTDQKITDYFRWINRWVTIPNFLRRYEDEPPEADIEV